MPTIQPFLDLERHITISSRPRTAQASPGHGSLAMATWTGPDGDRDEADGTPFGPCDPVAYVALRPVSRSKEQAVAQVDAT